MNKDWRDFLRSNPKKLREILKNKKPGWRSLFESEGIDTDVLPMTLTDFINTWCAEDFILYAMGNEITTRWQFEVGNRTVYQTAYHLGVIDSENFKVRTGIESRKKWERGTFSRAWIDDYLTEHPLIGTVKGVSQGLRRQLRRAGLFDYLSESIRLRRTGTTSSSSSSNNSDPLHDLVQKIKKRELKDSSDVALWATQFPEVSQLEGLVALAEKSVTLVSSPYSTEIELFSPTDFRLCISFLGIETLNELELISKDLCEVLILKGMLHSVGLKYN